MTKLFRSLFADLRFDYFLSYMQIFLHLFNETIRTKITISLGDDVQFPQSVLTTNICTLKRIS